MAAAARLGRDNPLLVRTDAPAADARASSAPSTPRAAGVAGERGRLVAFVSVTRNRQGGFDLADVELTRAQLLARVRAGGVGAMGGAGAGSSAGSGAGAPPSSLRAAGAAPPAPAAPRAAAPPPVASAVGYRELSAVDPVASDGGVRAPLVLCRAGCVVLALPPLPAILTATEALLFPAAGADDALARVAAYAQDATYGRWAQMGADAPAGGPARISFEGVLIAALLRVLEERAGGALAELEARAHAALARGQVVEAQIATVLSALYAVERFVADAAGVHKAVEAVLDNDDDLEGLVLSVPRWQAPAGAGIAGGGSGGGGGGRGGGGGGGSAPAAGASAGAAAGEAEESAAAAENPAWRSDVVATEETLEWFLTSVDGALSRARLLLLRLDAERSDTVELKLANKRNGYQRLQLAIQAFQVVAASGAMMGGWFAMNLSNGACGPVDAGGGNGGCRDGVPESGFRLWRTLAGSTEGIACAAAAVVIVFAVFRSTGVAGVGVAGGGKDEGIVRAPRAAARAPR